ncbi:UDP-N-acetylglucosamine 2-epimerase (hydrolysing) [Rhodobacter aestuarii]|uniref:UDP-N-acetylglucosamine 2-epimerase (Hydrolysing) n=1 Tax=Rhodobacter aestuarii TaxID=453582 RepID=A0A1N7QA89_9RHOB|nr:UDP-N-acetylglucosamine 2-epimerase [Rhodobacter aestuarii]PTV93784.1 UDP-N-acetylglucosamine 2-epimerase (hydrolysing) [Rhodobacter aestuarii]SIT19507.1 UDP-N-acetylglucosamine 2-epimerase (hydrolysing) [Rhodobacter aestuarii]
MTRSILFVTGTRADFGKLEPLAIAARDAGFNVSFFVTGMHMLDLYGLTKIEVRRVTGVAVHEFLNQRIGDPQDTVLAKTVAGFSDFVVEHRPDLVVIHGDRVEALACALVCAMNYVRSAHIEGGEVSGTIDEMFRHCNTKLSTHHFVSSEEAKRRVMVLGEPDANVHVIGSPELDFHAGPSGVTLDEVRARYQIPFEEFGIATFHPVTSEVGTMGAQAQGLFGAMEASGRNFVVIAPNNDPGSEAIFATLEKLPRERFRLLPSMRFAHFSELMKHAACMVGNSSAGVREAPFLGLPSLDVGTRQTNRAEAPSIFKAPAQDSAAIANFLAQEWGKRYPRHTAFGSGRAAELFIETLNDVAFWESGLQKTFADHD